MDNSELSQELKWEGNKTVELGNGTVISSQIWNFVSIILRLFKSDNELVRFKIQVLDLRRWYMKEKKCSRDCVGVNFVKDALRKTSISISISLITCF